jgi:hypothetical protein
MSKEIADTHPLQSAASEWVDPVIEAYKRDVDRTLLRENLKLTPTDRLLKLQDFTGFLADLREAGKRARRET